MLVGPLLVCPRIVAFDAVGWLQWVSQTPELGTATSSMGIIRRRGAVGLITSWETERCGRAGHGVVEVRRDSKRDASFGPAIEADFDLQRSGRAGHGVVEERDA